MCRPDVDWSLEQRREWAAKIASELRDWASSGSQMRFAMVIGDAYRSGNVDRANLWTLRAIVEAVADSVAEAERILALEPRPEGVELKLAAYRVYMPEDVAGLTVMFDDEP